MYIAKNTQPAASAKSSPVARGSRKELQHSIISPSVLSRFNALECNLERVIDHLSSGTALFDIPALSIREQVVSAINYAICSYPENGSDKEKQNVSRLLHLREMALSAPTISSANPLLFITDDLTDRAVVLRLHDTVLAAIEQVERSSWRHNPAFPGAHEAVCTLSFLLDDIECLPADDEAEDFFATNKKEGPNG